MASTDLVAQCRRSAHFWRAWIERGDSPDSEAEVVFKDTALGERLTNPLHHFEKGAASSGTSSTPLPDKASALARKASDAFDINQESAENLVRLYADERLGSYCVLHHQGSEYDLLDFSSEEKTIGELSVLYHSERCETLEIVRSILRVAQDNEHPYQHLCHASLSKFFVPPSNSRETSVLHENLWSLYKKVSSRPLPSNGMPHLDIQNYVHEVLDLELRILESLVLIHEIDDYHRRLPNSSETRDVFCEMVEQFDREHFLGYFYVVAGSHRAPHPWLLGDKHISTQAQCVGDLCVAVLLAFLKPEKLRPESQGLSAVRHHHLFGDQMASSKLHEFFTLPKSHRTSWVEKCESAVDRRAAPSGVGTHFAHMASLMLLGWAATLATETTLRMNPLFSLDRILQSAVFRSQHLVEDAVASILRRGYLTQHTPLCDHGAVRSVLHTFVTVVASSFRLDKVMPGILSAMGRLMHAASVGEPMLSDRLLALEHAASQGPSMVFESYFETFPLSLADLLLLIGCLGARYESGGASQGKLPSTLIGKSIDHVLLPYHPSHISIAPISSSDDIHSTEAAQVVLQEPLYLEELALRALGLVMSEWHVRLSVVIRPGTKGELQDSASDGGTSFASSARCRKVRWKLPSPGISIWRLALVSWDAALESLGCTHPVAASSASSVDSPAAKILLSVVQCISELLISRPEALFELSAGLPDDDCQIRITGYDGLIARLLASFHGCACLGAQASSALPLILRALGACARLQPKEAVVPPYAVLLHLLEGGPSHRFKHGDAKALIEVLTASLDREREDGFYPITLAALVFFEDFLRSCSAELFVLPAYAHIAVSFLNGDEDLKNVPSIPVSEKPQGSRGIETLGMLTDFTFGLCFARCSFWSCRTATDRLQLVLACLRIASALLPCMECFNWSTSFDGASSNLPQQASAQSLHVADALKWLRALQFRVQRSWSESSFVPTLLHWICCDIAFDAINGDASKPSMGLRVPAMEVSFQTRFVMPYPGENCETMEPVSGVKVVGGALACLHGLLSLVLRPGGIAPEFADLARHLLALSMNREPLGTQPVVGVFSAPTKLVPQRAGLVQSLYGLCFAKDSAVAAWSARVMTAVCVLWKHRELQSSTVKGSADCSGTSHEPQLLAFLSVPTRPMEAFASPSTAAPAGTGVGNNAKPTFLSSHLVRKLIDVVSECQDVSLRCAFADLIRVLLKTQPGLFLGEELFSKAVCAVGNAVAELVGKSSAMSLDTDSAHLLSVLMGVLDNLASCMNDTMFVNCFASKGPGASGSQHSTMWQLFKSLVSELLLPWAEGKGEGNLCSGEVPLRLTPSCMVVVAAVFRLASRGCAVSGTLLTQNQQAHTALVELVNVLLGETGVKLWFHYGPPTASRSRSRADDFSLMAHPYGAVSDATLSAPWHLLQDARTTVGHVEAVLEQYKLRATQLGATADSSQSAVVDVTESSSVLGPGTSNNSRTGALLQTYGGRCSIPSSFRWWSDVCELACGSVVDLASPVQLGLPIWQPPLLNDDVGASSLNVGCWSWDAHFVGTPCSVHGPSVRWIAAQILVRDMGTPEILNDLKGLVSECNTLPIIQAGIFARVLAMDSFHEFVHIAARQVHLEQANALGTQVSTLLKPLTLSLSQRLYGSLQHLDLLSDYAAFFSRLLRLVTSLIAMPPQISAIMSESAVMAPFSSVDGAKGSASDVQGMLDHETPMGLALIRQLGAALHTCSLRVRSCDDLLPPRTGSLTSGAAFYKGHADVVLALLSMLMLLVPALRPKQLSREPENFFEGTSLLSDLLQVLADLVDCLKETEHREVVVVAEWSSNKQGLPSAVRFAKGDVRGAAGPAGRHVASSDVASPESLNGVALLQSSEDALARTASATQVRALDHLLRTGTAALVLRLTERAVTILREREESRKNKEQEGHGSLGSLLGEKKEHDKVCGVLRGMLLPRLLTWAFMPNIGSQIPLALGERPDATAVIWDRAVEAAWACRLESVLSVMFAVAQTAPGAVMLAEQRIFSLLAACQLFQYAVLPDDATGQFPAPYAWPRNLQRQRVGDAAPWRRPLHESWCRALLLVSTLLSSAPQLLSEATVFLQRFAPRFRYLFRSGVQSGQLAMLEEATATCRILSLMAHRCGLAETLLADAASQSLIFIVRTCLADASSPLEVFAPVSAVERISARLDTENETVPAEVPSIFHQRIQFLALNLSRNVLLALLRVVSTSVWRSNAAAWVSSSPWTSSASASAPKGWSNMPSVLGLGARSSGSLGVGNSDEQAGPQRLWAALMDITLEGAQRFVGILEVLRKNHTFPLLSVSARKGSLIPLSLSIAALGEEASPADSGWASPQHLSLKAPLAHHPPGQSPASPTLGAKRKSEKRSPMNYKCMALRPDSWVGGQANAGVVPEYTTVKDLKELCNTNLEMACTLLCHYCQATVSSINDRSAPAVNVLHGVLSFLHKLRASELFYDDCCEDPPLSPHLGGTQKRPTFKSKHWLVNLDEALRASQQLETDGAMPSFASSLEPGTGEEFYDLRI